MTDSAGKNIMMQGKVVFSLPSLYSETTIMYIQTACQGHCEPNHYIQTQPVTSWGSRHKHNRDEHGATKKKNKKQKVKQAWMSEEIVVNTGFYSSA